MTHHILIIEDERDCAQHRRLASAARLRGGLEQGRRWERIDQRQGQQLVIDFVTSPSKYRHWKLQFAGEVAELIVDVDENAGLFEGYQLKLIELADLQRLRFEHPEVKAVDPEVGQGQGILRRRQPPNARRLAALPQGQLLRNRQIVGAGFHKIANITLRFDNHEVYIERLRG